MWPKLDEFMCGIDGRVAKERPEREVRNMDGLRSGRLSVDGEDGLAVVTAAVAVASAAAVALALLKVLVGSLSRSQVGWEVSDTVLACPAVLLSSSRCVAWCFLISCAACMLSTGSQVLSLSGYPFHLIRYWSLHL